MSYSQNRKGSLCKVLVMKLGDLTTGIWKEPRIFDNLTVDGRPIQQTEVSPAVYFREAYATKLYNYIVKPVW